MDRSFLPGILVAGTLILATFSIIEVQSEPRVDEDYYLNDIQAAVKEAQRNPRKHQFDYANKYWYNRTTAESFELPKLNSSDMDDARLDGALAATAAGGKITTTNPASPDLPADEQADMVKSDQDAAEQERLVQRNPNTLREPPQMDPTPFTLVVDKMVMEYPGGETTTIEGVYSSGTLISTPRP